MRSPIDLALAVANVADTSTFESRPTPQALARFAELFADSFRDPSAPVVFGNVNGVPLGKMRDLLAFAGINPNENGATGFTRPELPHASATFVRLQNGAVLHRTFPSVIGMVAARLGATSGGVVSARDVLEKFGSSAAPQVFDASKTVGELQDGAAIAALAASLGCDPHVFDGVRMQSRDDGSCWWNVIRPDGVPQDDMRPVDLADLLAGDDLVVPFPTRDDVLLKRAFSAISQWYASSIVSSSARTHVPKNAWLRQIDALTDAVSQEQGVPGPGVAFESALYSQLTLQYAQDVLQKMAPERADHYAGGHHALFSFEQTQGPSPTVCKAWSVAGNDAEPLALPPLYCEVFRNTYDGGLRVALYGEERFEVLLYNKGVSVEKGSSSRFFADPIDRAGLSFA